MKKITLAFLILALNSYAADNLPYGYMHSNKEDSTLSVKCASGNDPSKIHCLFVQMSVRRKSTQEIEKSTKGLDTSKDDELVTILKSCKKMNQTVKDLEALMKEAGPAKREKLSNDKQWLFDLCHCERKKGDKKEIVACVRNLLQEKIEEEKKTCVISNNSFNLEFTKANDNKWVSNPGPMGICKVANVGILERDSKDSLWTYSQTRISADRSSKVCMELEINVPTVFSWKASNESKMDCQVIKLGY